MLPIECTTGILRMNHHVQNFSLRGGRGDVAALNYSQIKCSKFSELFAQVYERQKKAIKFQFPPIEIS